VSFCEDALTEIFEIEGRKELAVMLREDLDAQIAAARVSGCDWALIGLQLRMDVMDLVDEGTNERRVFDKIILNELAAALDIDRKRIAIIAISFGVINLELRIFGEDGQAADDIVDSVEELMKQARDPRSMIRSGGRLTKFIGPSYFEVSFGDVCGEGLGTAKKMGSTDALNPLVHMDSICGDIMSLPAMANKVVDSRMVKKRKDELDLDDTIEEEEDTETTATFSAKVVDSKVIQKRKDALPMMGDDTMPTCSCQGMQVDLHGGAAQAVAKELEELKIEVEELKVACEELRQAKALLEQDLQSSRASLKQEKESSLKLQSQAAHRLDVLSKELQESRSANQRGSTQVMEHRGNTEVMQLRAEAAEAEIVDLRIALEVANAALAASQAEVKQLQAGATADVYPPEDGPTAELQAQIDKLQALLQEERSNRVSEARHRTDCGEVLSLRCALTCPVMCTAMVLSNKT